MKTKLRISKHRIYRHTAFALISVSSVVMLQGCSLFGMKNPISSDRPEQVVAGARRQPVLNAAPPASQTPYAAEASSAPTNLSSSNSHSPSNQNQVRKPIPGNPSGMNSAASTSPVVNVASSRSASSQPASLGHISAAPTPAQDTADDSTAALSAPAKTSDENTRPVPRQLRAAPAPETSQDVTPPLSSVPPTPTEFKDISAAHTQQLEDMQSERTKAQREKTSLMAEPSGQHSSVTDVTPQLAPALTPAPAAATHDTNAEADTAPVADAAPPMTDTGPTAPRRGIDIMTQQEWNALQKARQEKASAPAPTEPPVEGD